VPKELPLPRKALSVDVQQIEELVEEARMDDRR